MSPGQLTLKIRMLGGDKFDVDLPSHSTVNDLKSKGYTIMKRGRFGRMDGIQILKDGMRNAAGDKRGDDSVAGY
jgi:hypothetical protein